MARWLAGSFAVAALAAMLAGIGGCRDVLGIGYLSDDVNDGSTADASGNSPGAGGDATDVGDGPLDASPGTRQDALALGDAAVEADSTAETGGHEAPDGSEGGQMGVAEAGDAPNDVAESGVDGAPCTNACTNGLTECVSGGVQTCEVQPNGCTQWVSTSTCGAHQSCSASTGSAACACNATVCTQAGAVCQDSQTLVTCATDSDGCLYAASTSPCTAPQFCSGMAPGAMCSTTCSNSCSQGQTSCVSGALATCTQGSNGCLAYGTPAACGSHQTCTGASGSASCTCNKDSLCAATGTVCADASTLATCAQDAQGCIYKSTSSACGSHKSCTGASGSAMCTCNASVCTQAGAVCQDSQTVATCAADPDGCLYAASMMSCTMPESCSGAAPNAMCALTCTSSCSQGQTSCVSGGLATCTLGSNGCWAYGPPSCGTHQTCTGAAGSAMCTCNVDPVCSATGMVCANQSTLATCAQDMQGCFYESTSMQCMNGNQCTGGGCSCPQGTHDCTGTCKSNTALDSCGTACTTTCPAPLNGSMFGSATCDGTMCGLSCITGDVPCNGSCVNEQTDAANCGACGHGCGGGTCSAGICTPVRIATISSGFGYGLAIDSSTLYFTDGLGGHINTCPLTGCTGTPTPLFSGITYAGQLFYDQATSTFFVTDPNADKVYAVAKAGTLTWSNSLGTGNVPANITADSTWVYWGQTGSIQKALKSSGASQAALITVSSGAVLGAWFDPTSNDIYGAQSVAAGSLLQCTPAGSCTTVTGPPFALATAVIVHGSTIYFSAGGTSPNFTDGGMYSAPVSAPTSVTPIATGPSYARALSITADSNNLYFASVQSGNVYECALSGCPSGPTEIGPAQGEAEGMANDSKYVYWTVQGGVMRWTK